MRGKQYVGAWYEGNGYCSFSVYAPEKDSMVLSIVSPDTRDVEMVKDYRGYFEARVPLHPGAKYFYKPDGEKKFPDPASFYQPLGVHGPSEVVDQGAFNWEDSSWKGIPQKELIIYELHVGTFTKDGTFEGVISRLTYLRDLGVTAIELMPVAQFPGSRNWGYDGVYPYAVQNSYGGPMGLKKLVNECHKAGIAVFLDVVYNHLGPEGNYLANYAPHFTDKYCTPWGDAINFDSEWCDGVKDYFVNNAMFWFEIYHVDGLRLDAIHTIFDSSAESVWQVLFQRTKDLEQRTGRPLYLTAESDLNSPFVVKHPDIGGFGFDAQWLDDFHHALYVILHRDGKERYEDFGAMEQLAKAYTDGFVHSGEFVTFRKRRHGTSSAGISGERFIVFNQNHDQVGNRVGGERLCALVDQRRVKLGAAAVLLSPYIPLLFMGEEYAEAAPFFYFVSHSDPHLVEAVREGRRKEFERFKWAGDHHDPQDESTFNLSKLNWQSAELGRHSSIRDWHKHLIKLRKTHPVLQNLSKNHFRATPINEDGLVFHRQTADGSQHLLCMFNFSEKQLSFHSPSFGRYWKKILDSTDSSWDDAGQAHRESVSLSGIVADNFEMPPLSVLVYESAQGYFTPE